jgi:hypothetical protein
MITDPIAPEWSNCLSAQSASTAALSRIHDRVINLRPDATIAKACASIDIDIDLVADGVWNSVLSGGWGSDERAEKDHI